MAEKTNNTSDRLSATFSPVSNAGVVLWLQPHQVTIIGVIIAWFLLCALVGAPLFTWFNGFLAIIAMLSSITFKGRSLIQLVMIQLGFGLRSATGNTRWTLNPLTQGETVGYVDLPGAMGKRLKPLEVVNTQFQGACFLLDTENGYITAVLRCMGKPFVFTKDEIKDARAAALSNLLASLAEYEDIIRLTIQTRSLMTPFTLNLDTDKGFASDEVQDMVAENMRHIMNHDMIITLTINPDKARDVVKNYGGGMQGYSALLRDRLVPVVDMLEQAGVDTASSIVWENSAQLRAMMKLLSDSHAYSTINSRLELDDTVPVATNYREYTDYLHVGDTYARTLWVDKWPSDPASMGFVSQLVAGTNAQIIFTQAFAPLSESKARKGLNNRKSELERIERMNRNMGRNSDPRLLLEEAEVDSRLTELAVHKAEVSFQGFITILAPSKEVLDTQTREIITSMPFMHFDRMHGQQYIGWINALPLGQAGR